MKRILIERKLLDNNPYLLKIRDAVVFETIPDNITGSDILLTSRNNEYIIPYSYGNNIEGKGEHVLRWGNGCIYNCTYCYVKQINKPYIQMFPDINAIMKEISALRSQSPILLNAGENFDSFILESRIPFCTELISQCSGLDNIQIEFRTKAIVPDRFIREFSGTDSDFHVAVSINPEYIRQNIEKKVPPVKSSISNIKKLIDNGIKTAIRFEPVILVKDHRKIYS
ncbi:MAG: radical SAM protein, partial [Candidatus Muiribacteriaceae bacterium]